MAAKRICGWLIGVLLFSASLGAAGTDSISDTVKAGNITALRTLLQQRPDLKASEPDGMTALHWAALRDNLEAADLLIGAGANAKVATRYGVTPLSLAATNGSAAMLEKLIAAGADPNTASPEGETVLMTAARTGKLDAVKVLLAHKADANTAEKWKGQTALMWAAGENHVDIIPALLAAGADVKARSTAGFTALLLAARNGSVESTRALLQGGASANDLVQPKSGPASPKANAGRQANVGLAFGQIDAGGLGRGEKAPDASTALALAIINAHWEEAVLLLDNGADPNAPDSRTSFLHAMAWMRKPGLTSSKPTPTGKLTSLDVVKSLLAHGANPNVRITWGENKASTERPEMRTPPNIDIGRNYTSPVGGTPFYLAAKHGDIAMMHVLVDNGADPSIPTAQNITPLMAAAGLGNWPGETPGPELGTPESDFLEAVKFCLELGNDINAAADYGNEPMEAMKGENLSTFLLVNNPINQEKMSDTAMGDMRWDGSTALIGAAVAGRSKEFLKYMVDHGAKLDQENKLGWVAYTVAYGGFFMNNWKARRETADALAEMMKEKGIDPDNYIRCIILSKGVRAGYCDPSGIPARFSQGQQQQQQ